MTPQLWAELTRTHGVIHRRAAIRAGLSATEVDRLVRRGEWIALRRAVYTTRAIWEAADVRRGRPLLQALAGSAAVTMPHVLSHDSAALVLGLEFWTPTPGGIHLTRPGVVGSHLRHGVKHHLAPYRPDQVTVVDGVSVLDRVRTALDIAREHGLTPGVTACEAALRSGVERHELETALEAMRNWPQVTVAREAAALADGGADNVAESLARLLVTELGRGRPETQFGLRADGRTAYCDIRIGRHLIEMDGDLKYQPPTDNPDGIAIRPASEIVLEEKKRQDFVCGFKLGMSRLTWSDLFGAARGRAKQRLLRELEDTEARFGSSIDDLAPYVVRRPRRGP